VTPYRDAPASRRVHTHWTSQPFTTVMSGAICIGLSAMSLVLFVADSSLAATTFGTAAVFGVLFQAGVIRLVVDGNRLLLVRGILGKRPVRSTPLTDDSRVRVTHQNRAYRAHVVELVTDNGSSVIAECDDHAEAQGIAKFVEQWLPLGGRSAL